MPVLTAIGGGSTSGDKPDSGVSTRAEVSSGSMASGAASRGATSASACTGLGHVDDSALARDLLRSPLVGQVVMAHLTRDQPRAHPVSSVRHDSDSGSGGGGGTFMQPCGRLQVRERTN